VLRETTVISMSGEVSYFSRFFVKFVEIVAAGLASAISAYLLAHFGGVLLSSPTPASAPVAPTASQVAEILRTQPTPPVAAAPVNERRTVPQKDTDAPAAQLAPNGAKEAKTLPLRKHTKTDTSVAEKEPRGQKSVEVLTRAALANIDANRPAPVDAPIGPGLNDTHARADGMQPRQASVPPRQADVGPRPVDVPPRAAAINAAQPAADAQPVQLRPATGTNLQPRSPDVRATVDPQPSSAAPQPTPADQDKDVFSALKRIPNLLRPDPPTATGEAPRPPMPVGTASPEREFGN
jgi:hypothetical protein